MPVHVLFDALHFNTELVTIDTHVYMANLSTINLHTIVIIAGEKKESLPSH